jgi:hypothetical protein
MIDWTRQNRTYSPNCREDGRIAFSQKPENDLRGVRSHQIDLNAPRLRTAVQARRTDDQNPSNLSANRLHHN